MIEILEDGPWTVIRPAGDITADASEELSERLSDLIFRKVSKIRFDLTGVNDIDAQGVSALAIIAFRVRRGLLDLTAEVHHAGHDVSNFFIMTGLNRIFEIKS